MMATINPPSPNSNKRKRGQNDPEPGRNMKPQTTNGDAAADAMYVSLLQGITDTAMPQQDDPSRTAQAALQQQQSSYPEPNAFDHAAAHGGFEDMGHMKQVPQHHMQGMGQSTFDARSPGPSKPGVGTKEWHQQRKDNHKEVERRRREVINEGIENIAKLIPSNDKNKGAVLQNACRFIQELQSKIASFDNERNVFEITQQELTRRNENLRDSAQRAWHETAKWMNRCRDAGLQFDDYDSSVEAAEVLGEHPVSDLAGGDNDASDVDKAEAGVA